jgi:hypothetical protein
MTNKLYSVLVVLVAITVLSSMAVTPVMADTDPDNDGHKTDNIICEGDGNDSTTPLGGLLSSVTLLLVTVAGLIAVLGGAAYTLASAANPTDEDYIEKRNNSVLYGGGALIFLYGANALVTELSASLDFSCVLPFA